MPRKRKPKPTDVPEAVLDHFAGPARVMTPTEVEDAIRRYKKALLERALGAELTHHLGYEPGATPDAAGNHRNGTTPKTVLTDDGPVHLEVPRDRAGTFDPVLIPKHERRFTGFDDKILALYARGLTVREIQGFLREMYAVEVSPDLISTVTDAVVDGCSSMRFASGFATKAPSGLRPCISRSACARTAVETSSGSGSSRPKG